MVIRIPGDHVYRSEVDIEFRKLIRMQKIRSVYYICVNLYLWVFFTNSMRILEEVYDEIRKNVGEDFPVMAVNSIDDPLMAEQLSFLGDKLAVIGDVRQCQNAMEAACEGFDAGYNASIT